MNNAVGVGDLDKMLLELSPGEREIIAKMISDRFDEMQAAWNEGYCVYGRKSRTTLLPLRDDPRPRGSVWGSFKRGIARLRAVVSVYLKTRTARGAE